MRIDPITALVYALIAIAAAYILWITYEMHYLEKHNEELKTEKKIVEEKTKAEIFSRDQLIKIKTKEPREELNLSLGTHRLVF